MKNISIACLLVVAVLALSPHHRAHAQAGAEISDFDRFKLFNHCNPIGVLVEGLTNDDDAAKIGLTNEQIEIAVRSRLRGARIYTDSYTGQYLYVNVNVLGNAYGISVRLYKWVKDRASGEGGTAITWNIGSTGTHGQQGANYILSWVANYTDKFIDEYLRVNAPACKK